MGFDDFYQSGRAPEYTFYNLGFERTITKDMTLTVAYVGSEAHHTYIKGRRISPRLLQQPVGSQVSSGLRSTGGHQLRRQGQFDSATCSHRQLLQT